VPDLATTEVARPRLRFGALVTIAVGLGLAIALIDSGPGWDDTGVTAVMLVGASALVAGTDGRRPSLWALLVGLPLPLIEVPASATTTPVVALAFTAIGAILGVLIRRAVRGPNAR
jgi:hypothetical protein